MFQYGTPIGLLIVKLFGNYVGHET